MPGFFKNHIMPDQLHILNVSFIMNTFRQEFGGTGGNIAWTLGLLNTPSVLVASAGDDFGAYKKHLMKNRFIDLLGIRVSRSVHTARGFVITDGDDNQIWGFYEGAMEESNKISLRNIIKGKEIVMIAPNSPKAMINYVNESVSLKVPYVFDPAFNIAHFTLSDLKRSVKNSHILIGNDYEITLIRRRLKLSSKGLLRNCNILVTTLGSKGSRIQHRDRLLRVPAAHPQNESDPTGAGDAFRAGFLAGYVRDLPLDVCGRMGSVAAVYIVEKYGTQTHSFTLTGFTRRYRRNFNGVLPDLKRG
jgi:adenosine kinase